MKKALTLLSVFLLIGSLSAQTVTKRIVAINGGQFGNPADNANVSSFDPATGSYTSLDTIQTQSIQDVLVEGRTMYVAAQDSIVKYDVVSGDRIASAAFGAPSTISMSIYNDYLLVGNWYAPFGQVGPYTNHFRIFDKNTLTFVDSIPEIHQGVKSFVVVGDTAYIGQNYTSSAYTDSAGWMVKVDLASLTYSDSITVNSMNEDFGRLMEKDGMVIGLNSASNSVTIYDPLTGSVMTDTANADLSLRIYGSQFVVDQFGTIHTNVGGNIATYDPISRSVIDADIVDTAITAFTLDTVNQRYYVTQTDFFSYVGGGIYDTAGQRMDTFLVGTSPEAIVAIYNELPVAVDDLDTFLLYIGVPYGEKYFDVLKNDIDKDATSLSLKVINSSAPGNFFIRNDSLIYQPTGKSRDTVWYSITDEWGDTDTAQLALFNNPFVSIEKELPGSSIKVFPNPIINNIQLEFEFLWSGKIRITNISGQTVLLHQQESSSAISMSLDELPAGIYILQGTSDQGNWQKKIIKE